MGWNISIHAPAKGATLMDSETLFSLKHFNPRSRKGSDVRLRFCVHCSKSFQSTLPQRERRYSDGVSEDIVSISIHAPAKGATSLSSGCKSSQTDFNPRSRKGSDVFGFSSTSTSLQISIHAPAKGATLKWKDQRDILMISIHAPAKGATRIADFFIKQYRFQSTLPQRERQCLCDF